MLVLSRKRDEIVCVGQDIKVMVVRVNPDGSVRLGIRAPRDVRISRDFVPRQLKSEDIGERRQKAG